ncbi:MAG: HD domain-containing protein [Deltaproteobacteria bacterium]|nr:HD domain-containing protein [Deltaproteobacteria bacterium]
MRTIYKTMSLTMNGKNPLILDYKNRIRSYFSRKASWGERLMLEGAFLDIENLFRNQYRLSGKPVVVHSLRVAALLCQVGADFRSVIAGLLHDTLEDTHLTKEEIRQGYGKWVAGMSESLKKTQNQEQTHQKLLQAGHHDIRSLKIKFCDRLDNMREIQWLTPYKRRRISRESLQFYLPFSAAIGIPSDKRDELESLAARFL